MVARASLSPNPDGKYSRNKAHNLKELQTRKCVSIFEPRFEKTGFLLNAKLISAFVFTTRIVQYLFFLNPKFQASRHLL